VNRGLRLEGLFGVLPTAFHDDGRLDLAGTEALTRAYCAAGAAGLTVLGVMGESAELTEPERGDVLGCVLAAAGGVPVIVGVSGPDGGVVALRSLDAARRGVSGLMVSPSATLGLVPAVAAAAKGGLPVLIQDYPAGSGVVLTAAEMGAVAEQQPLVIGVKAEGPPTSGVVAELRDGWPRLAVLGGLGGLFLIDELREGAAGVMTGFPLPDRLVAILRTWPTDPVQAERDWIELLPLMRLEAFPPFNLAARKEVWRLRGVIGSSHCRRAGVRLDDHARLDIRLALERVTGGPVRINLHEATVSPGA
jgi:4-hydroxy-tetrahydrodipicolinate synthase